ncbi:hypothetical protein [Mycobacterium sp. 1081908.1]|nr:hypothetical protein [Mycobacterium sp. 1081908.1]
MTWYCWATQLIMVIALTARQLRSHGTESDRSADHRGINDEIYRQRIM